MAIGITTALLLSLLGGTVGGGILSEGLGLNPDHSNLTKDGRYLKKQSGWGADLLDAMGWIDKNPSSEEIYKAIPELRELNLSESELQNLINSYANEDSSLLGNTNSLINIEDMLNDLSKMSAAVETMPEEPVYADYLDSAREQIASENEEMYADLDRLLENRTNLYNDQLSNLADGYNDMRSGILSQQYARNAQLMDTLQSGMEKSRRNALEAGASAGIRIADNINTLLSVQNKQSATSMETANQLAQMMVNQRNAEASVRGAYADTLAEDTSNRHAIKLGSEQRASSLADTNYNSAYNSYSKNETDWSNQNAYNPMYDYRNRFNNNNKSNNVN